MGLADAFRALIDRLASQAPATETIDPSAEAALVLALSVIRSDGTVDVRETDLLERLISEHYRLDPRAYKALLVSASDAQSTSTDEVRFAAHLRRHWTELEREAYVGLLWQLARADDIRNEIEEDRIHRIAEMIGVSGRDRSRAT